jgi:hypothetical protein
LTDGSITNKPLNPNAGGHIMDFIPLETLQNIRNIVALSICMIAFIILFIRNPEFKQMLYAELLKKHYQKIYHRLLTLEKMNEKTMVMVRQMGSVQKKAKFIPDSDVIERRKYEYPAEMQKNTDAYLSLQNYENIKEFMQFGMSASEIGEITRLPKAEIDFMLKFNRLHDLSQSQNNSFKKKTAYS